MKHILWYIQTHLFVKHYVVELKQVVNANNNGFNRYDIVIRLLAIENYYGENDFGWGMYRKLRTNQLGDVTDVHKVERIFKDLIRSYETYGYMTSSEIFVDKSFRLVNGAHRIALALYRNEKHISCCVIHKKSKSDYSLDNLKRMGFTNNELDIIERRYQLVMQSLT